MLRPAFLREGLLSCLSGQLGDDFRAEICISVSNGWLKGPLDIGVAPPHPLRRLHFDRRQKQRSCKGRAIIIANFTLSVAPLTVRTLSHTPVAACLLVHGGHHLRLLDEGDAATVQAKGVAEHFRNRARLLKLAEEPSGHRTCKLCHGTRRICLAASPTTHAVALLLVGNIAPW
jgi:hypothetical protein